MKNCDSKSCCDNSCQSQKCENNTGGSNNHGKFLLELGDCAWTEALKGKIKEYILQQDNECLTELARLIAESNKKRWENKMCQQHGCQEFEDQLCSFFSKKNSSQK
jgi:hypothetical protein